MALLYRAMKPANNLTLTIVQISSKSVALVFYHQDLHVNYKEEDCSLYLPCTQVHFASRQHSPRRVRMF